MNQEFNTVGGGYRNEPGLRDFINVGERQITSTGPQPLVDYIDAALLKTIESLVQQVVSLESKLLPVTITGALQTPHVHVGIGVNRQNIAEISPASEVRLKLKAVENELIELSHRLMNLTMSLDV